MLLRKSLLLTVIALCVAIAPSFGQAAAKKAVPAKAEAAAGLIDINSADAATLKSIPGIGDAYSAKIIANRPYKGKDEIVKKAGVPQGVYDKIKDKIIAKQK
ncbi:MAG: helix-hairpin-helix domain-containing protein [Acidobacteriaceae bacterium]|jgi:DNA uptake protein ComE-like DNA-binding protein|nr:helix-hairpin-helix domain-containing protein [Acidobacteriaceae bacterium]